MRTTTMIPIQTDLLDEALDRLHTRGEEWLGGLTSHATMVAEALEHVGRSDAIGPFVATYLDRLEDPLGSVAPIDPVRWRERLGQRASTSDWVAFFRRELADRGWQATVTRWVPRFVPGVITAATHGVIRTSHAVRGLGVAATAPRAEELAHALGYWAASYETLPVALPRGARTPEEALDAVPVLGPDARTEWLISDRIRRIDADRFTDAIRSASLPDDPIVGVAEVARLGARMLVANPQAEIAFVHAVTAPTSLLALVPHLPGHVATAAVGEAFKAVAALWAAYGEAPLAIAPPAPSLSWDAIVDAAITDGDEHHIKLAVAARDLALAGFDADGLLAAAAESVLPARS